MTERRQDRTVSDIKLLLTALAIAGTITGWAALSQQDLAASADQPAGTAEGTLSALGDPAPHQPVVRSVTLPSASVPPPIAITRSSR
ncbi:MAG: hypothetical protein IRY83_01175 [Chloroflexi bacterium]|nr:hypothetical protein [Chloroflexota bacterium]